MPQINLEVLQTTLQSLPSEEIVSAESVSPYLLSHVIRPVQQGQVIRYRDLDFDQFDDLDLEHASDYCSRISDMQYKLGHLSNVIGQTSACAIRRRSFC